MSYYYKTFVEYFATCKNVFGMHKNACALNIHALNDFQGG